MFQDNIQKKIEEHYGKNTIKSVYSRMRRIFKMLNIDDNDLHKVIRNNGQDLIEAVETAAPSVRHTLLYQVIALCNMADIKFPEAIRAKAKEYKLKADRDLTAKKRTSVVNPDFNIDDIHKYFYDQLFKEEKRYSAQRKDKQDNPIELKPKKPKPSKMKYARLALFTLLKRRACRFSEFAGMKYTDDKETNFIDLYTKEIVIRKQKSSNLTKKKKCRRLVLSIEECNILQACKDYLNSDFVIPYLHSSLSDKPCSAQKIEAMYRSAIKTFCKDKGIEYKKGKMGIHILRSIEATKDVKNKVKINCSIEDLERIINNAKERDHSIETMLRYYVMNQSS